MKFKIVRNTVFKGKPVNAEEIVDVEEKDRDIRFLVSIGKAEIAQEKASKSVTAGKKETETGKSGENSDPLKNEVVTITPPENASEETPKRKGKK